MSTKNKFWSRFKFLLRSHRRTRQIHFPILNSLKTKGFANPAGLARPHASFGRRVAALFSPKEPDVSPSMVLFDNVTEYEKANAGKSQYGGPEYGVVGSPASVSVCNKFSDLHGGSGAIIQNSGLAAISRVLETFLEGDSPRILVPDNSYSPVIRKLKHMQRLNPRLTWDVYSSEANGEEVEDLLQKAKREGRPYNVVYMESPGSYDFKIADLQGITDAAKRHGAVSVMDNSYGALNFKPIKRLGLDVVVQATTKYESGYGDAASGIAIARTQEHASALRYTVRADGSGAVPPALCRLLEARVESVEERMKLHFEAAKILIKNLEDKPYVKTILAPFIDDPDNQITYERFQEYFHGKGNGLFTVVFNEAVTKDQVNDFVDNLQLIRLTESWGAHVSAALPVTPQRQKSTLPTGEMLRVSVGLEHPKDLIRDWTQAAEQSFATKKQTVTASAPAEVYAYA